jgi:hypothetical protein
VAQDDDEALRLAGIICRDHYSAAVRHTYETSTPGAAAAHWCHAQHEAHRRAEAALLRDLDPST